MEKLFFLILIALAAASAEGSSFKDRILANHDHACDHFRETITSKYEPVVEGSLNNTAQLSTKAHFDYGLVHCKGKKGKETPLEKLVRDFSDAYHGFYVYCNASDTYMHHLYGPENMPVPVIAIHFYMLSADPTAHTPSQCPIREGDPLKLPTMSMAERLRLRRDEPYILPTPPPMPVPQPTETVPKK